MTVRPFPEVDDAEHARQLISDVAELKVRTKRQLQADGWQWLVVWSFVAFGAAATIFVGSLNAVAPYYWLGALPLALAITGFIDVRSMNRRQVIRRQAPYWVTGAGIGIANFGLTTFVPPEVSIPAVWVVVGVGFTVIAVIDRNPVGAVILGLSAIGVFAIAVGASDPFVAYGVQSIFFGTALLVAALATWQTDPAS